MLSNTNGSGSYVLCGSAVKGNKWAGVIVSASDTINTTCTVSQFCIKAINNDAKQTSFMGCLRKCFLIHHKGREGLTDERKNSCAKRS